jgi:hypothetical protein
LRILKGELTIAGYECQGNFGSVARSLSTGEETNIWLCPARAAIIGAQTQVAQDVLLESAKKLKWEKVGIA